MTSFVNNLLKEPRWPSAQASVLAMASLSAALLAADEELWAGSVDSLAEAVQLETKLQALLVALAKRYSIS